MRGNIPSIDTSSLTKLHRDGSKRNVPPRSGILLGPPTDPVVIELIDQAKVRITAIRQQFREL